MSFVNGMEHASEPACDALPPVPPGQQLHRIGSVRRQEGLSLRSIARKLRVDVRELRRQEDETTDLRLSELYQWQQVLEVPVADLLNESDANLSTPVLKRAQLVKVMKTARSLLEQADHPRTRRLATMLVEQLVELMPELEGVGAWPSVGQRRTLDDVGRIADVYVSRTFSRVEEQLG